MKTTHTHLLNWLSVLSGEIDDLRKEIEVVQRDFILHASTCVLAIRRGLSYLTAVGWSGCPLLLFCSTNRWRICAGAKKKHEPIKKDNDGK